MRWAPVCCRTCVNRGIRNSKLPATPPRYWLNFLATTGRRARFIRTKDAVNWAKTGDQATSMTVVEISDPSGVVFPGFDSLLVSFGELQAVISDDRYGQWRTALSFVQGIYLISDTSNGRLYVGKADGAERFLGAGASMPGTATAAMSLSGSWLPPTPGTGSTSSSAFCRSSPSSPAAQVDAAEAHFKRALLTRQFGMNLN